MVFRINSDFNLAVPISAVVRLKLLPDPLIFIPLADGGRYGGTRNLSQHPERTLSVFSYTSSKEFGKIVATKAISNDAIQVRPRRILLLHSRLLLSRLLLIHMQ